MTITGAFNPSTWRILGLSVAASYVALGAAALVLPSSTSRVFGIPLGPGPIHEDSVARSFKLVGVRDISIAVALFAYNARDDPYSMGVLISSTMILCAWDVYECARNTGVKEALVLGAVATFWGFIGVGLLGLNSF